MLDEKNNLPLCSEIHNLKQIQQMRKENKEVFYTQYQQKPLARSGSMYGALKTYDPTDFDFSNSICIGACDVANGGGDFLACIFAYLYNGKIYVHDVVYTKENATVTTSLITEKSNRYSVVSLICESNNQGSIFIQNLQANGVQAHGFFNTTNKATRILMYSNFIEKNFVFNSQMDFDFKKFFNDLTSFPRD